MLLALPLYFIPLLLAYYCVKDVGSKLPRIGLIICAVAAAIMAIWFAILSGEQMGGLLFAAILMVLVFPPFLVGLGLTLGGWSKKLKLRNRIGRYRAVFAFSILFPAFGIGGLIFGLMQKEKARAQDIYDYQSLTLEEVLGPHKLWTPISPQVEVYHKCHFQKQTGEALEACLAKEYSYDYRFVDASERAINAPYLNKLTIMPSADDCESHVINKRECVAPKKLQDWCVRRVEFADLIWCTNRLRYKIVFEEYFPPNEYSLKFEAKSWSELGLPSIGTDASGSPVTIMCSTRRDEINASRKANNYMGREMGRHCRVKYFVADKVIVESTFNASGEAHMTEIAAHIYETANDFWEDMVTPAK